MFINNPKRTPIKEYTGILLISVLGVIGTLAASAAVAQNVSISTAIISLPVSMVLVFILSFLKPDLLEKHTLKVYAVRFFAAVVMFVATLGL